MDYKKLYEKAVERAKTLTNSGFNDFDFVKHIFPELKESEDERIKNEIINFIKDNTLTYTNRGSEIQMKWIAWLEKQVPVDEEKVLIGARKDVALSIINYLDNNSVGMCLSNMECEDIEDACVNSKWTKLYNYMKKKLEKQGDDNKEYWRGYREGKQEILDKYAELEKQGEQNLVEFKPLFRVGDVIKPKDPVLGEPRIIKGIHPKFGYDTNNGTLDFEYEDNWEAVEEPVSEGLEEASKNYVLNNTPWDDCKDEIQESFKAGANWQKAKDESTTEDLGEYINELSKQFPEVSFAKLSRIAVRVAKWQREQMEKEYSNLNKGLATAKGLAVTMAYDKGMADAREQMMKNIWKPADGDDLPEYDRGTIVLTQPYPLKGSEFAVSFAHRPNPNGWDVKRIITGKVEHYTPKTYGKGGWNIPDVKYWLDVKFPK